MPSDIAAAEIALLALDVRDLQGYGDVSKVDLLVLLEFWLRLYPLSCGSEWHLLVVARDGG